MSRYSSGRIAEWRVRDELLAQGFYVIRAAGSKGRWDLVAFRPGGTGLLIQVKRNRRASPAERREMLRFEAPKDWQKQCWFLKRGRPPQIIDLSTGSSERPVRGSKKGC